MSDMGFLVKLRDGLQMAIDAIREEIEKRGAPPEVKAGEN